MKILALIPARKNSRRLPNKNKIIFFNKPLFLWSVDIAKKIPEICDILVSTDDDEILKISRKFGILAPWLRPKKLSSANTSSIDMAQHALKWYEKKIGKIDGLLLLQPTSPLRSKKTLIKCIKTFKNKKCDSVITVKKASMNPKFLVQINNNLIKPILKGANEKHLPKDIYQPDGSIYLIKPSVLKNSEKFYGKRTIPIIVDSPKESIDIDTLGDLELAKFYKNKFN
jgi:CMP-N,N'-diacetyllegionaminic acid synthase